MKMLHKILIKSDNREDFEKEVETNPMLSKCREETLKELSIAMDHNNFITLYIEKED